MSEYNDENAPPNKKRVIDDLQDGFLPLGKPYRSFVGTKRTRISSSVAVVAATSSLSSYRGVTFGPSSLELSSIGGHPDCSTTFANPHEMEFAVDAPREGSGDDGIYNATGIVRDERRRSLRQVSDEPDEDIMPLLPPQHTIPFPGCRCPLFNLYQQKEAELLKTMFKNYVKFPTLQRGSDGNVIVDFHPEYIDFSAKAAERHMSSTSPVLTAIFGHYASILQQ